jgi:addiction module HigA family antidote
MKNPPHPGEVIREEILRPLGLSLTKAAGILGVRRATLSDLANGKTVVSAEMALRLEKAFGVSTDLLLCMQAGYDAAQARRRAAEIDVRRYRPDLAPATDRDPRGRATATTGSKPARLESADHMVRRQCRQPPARHPAFTLTQSTRGLGAGSLSGTGSPSSRRHSM